MKSLTQFIFQADRKSEIDIQAAVKMPPMPGQSRSLLQFDGVNNDIADLNDFHGQVILASHWSIALILTSHWPGGSSGDHCGDGSREPGPDHGPGGPRQDRDQDRGALSGLRAWRPASVQ